MSRQEANRMIVEAIKDVVELYPDWRFHQILQNMGVEQQAIDQWHEESEKTLGNVNINFKPSERMDCNGKY